LGQNTDEFQGAVIKEALRLSFGVTTRLPRIAKTDIEYKGYVIPAGVSSSAAWIETWLRREANLKTDSDISVHVFRDDGP